MNTWLPLALTAFALMLYFVLPTHAGEVQIISSRALHWATLFGIIIPPLGPTLERAAMGRGALLTASFLLALGYSTLIAVRSADYTKHVVGSLPTAVARLPNKSRLVWMNLDFSNPITHQGALWHLGVGLHMLHNGGLVSDSFARTPHHAVQYRAHKIPPSFNIDEIAAEGSHDYDFMILNAASIPAHWKGTHCINLRFRQFRWWLFEVKRPPCSAQP